MAFDPSNLLDPSTYTTAIGAMKRNYSYTVRLDSTLPNGLPSTQFVTINSNNIIDEESILLTATSFQYTGESGENIGAITEATIISAKKSQGV